MTLRSIFTIASVVALCACASLASAAPVSVASLLCQETSLSTLSTAADWTTRLDSSYDRTGGNGDFNNFVSADGDTATLADLQGPGAVVRIWSANPKSGHIRIYIDDNPAPVVDMPFDQMLAGRTDPFLSPLTQVTMGGHWTYLPISYAKRCRITVERPDALYYHVTSVRFPNDAVVRSFALPLADDDRAALNGAIKAWTAPYANLPVAPDVVSVRPGSRASFREVKGTGKIDQLIVAAPDTPDLELRRLVIRITFDHHRIPDIEAPLADFFGNAYGHKTFDSLALAQTPAGEMICRLPMPFGKSVQISVENGNGRPVTVSVATHFTPGGFKRGRDLYLHADFHQDLTTRGKPHVWMATSGQTGRFVGVVQAMESPYGIGYLEGDEQIRVDDEQFAACKTPGTVIAPWNGTGTEDYFNSGWYFAGTLLAAPLHGCLKKDEAGQIDAFRFLLLDAPVFQHSIDAQIEHGGENDFAPKAYYSSVAFWYGSGERTPVAPMPPASTLALPFSPVPRLTLQGPGVIEGESLVRLAKATEGSVSMQTMGGYDDSWSRGTQLFWKNGVAEDTLIVPINVANAGRYEVIAYLTKADDYGMFTFSLADQQLGGAFDAYNDRVVNSGPISLGTVALPPGPSPFVVTIAGKNPASRATFFGLDAIVLKPL
ncbi:MAG: DUF2961 domain-containing protein [Capsulimonadaceae bacterium]|nr:DUF2961 domain-containing protein [Capsulimonadaceae bacterium]